MNVRFATPSYPAPGTLGLTRAKYVMAAILVIMAVGQLLAFEKMGVLIGAELPRAWQPFTKVIASILALLEVAALPSLLNVAVSPAARFVSRLSGLLVFVLWYFVVLGGMMNGGMVNSGLLGEYIPFDADIISLLFVMILFFAMLVIHFLDMSRVVELSSKQKHAKIRK